MSLIPATPDPNLNINRPTKGTPANPESGGKTDALEPKSDPSKLVRPDGSTIDLSSLGQELINVPGLPREALVRLDASPIDLVTIAQRLKETRELSDNEDNLRVVNALVHF